MAIVIPQSLPAKITQGEKRFFQILAEKLPDDFYLWYEPRIEKRYPDFIILSPTLGLLIIEVKGWYHNQILEAKFDKFKIASQSEEFDSLEIQKSPLRQAKDYLDKLLNELKKYKILTHESGEYQGNIAFPIGWGAVMSNITEEQADKSNIKLVLPPPQVAYRNELLSWENKNFTAQELIQRLKGMFSVTFTFPTLTSEQINTIKGIIYPEIVVRVELASHKKLGLANQTSLVPSNIILKTLDSRQEAFAKSIGGGHRVFFGVSGSGKTWLLISRAKLLINEHPEAKVLITCFNICLASYIRSILHEDLNNPQYKNIEITNFHTWASSILGGLPNSVSGNFDEIIGNQVLEKLFQYNANQKWDAIFIDEAHTFVPVWFQCCVNALKDPENSNLMIVADGSQSLYKREDFSWKQVGVKAQGRTISKKFDLDKNYRNTQEVLSAAWWLLSNSREKHEVLENEDVTFPCVEPSAAMRSGERPKVYITSLENQQQVIIDLVQELQEKGVDTHEIAIMYKQANKSQEEQLKNIIGKFNQNGTPIYWVTKNKKSKDNYSHNNGGIRVITCLSSLGLEFKAVLILWLEQFDDCTGKTQGALLACKQLYVAMTRTQEYLYLLTSTEAKILEKLQQSDYFDVVR